jgi:RNA polymerase sigma factor (sigma-70 family)
MTDKEFTEVIDKTKKVVLAAVARNLYHDFHHAIDDVVQETYIRAYKALTKNSFDDRASITSWLYTIARNESLRMNSRLYRTSVEPIDNYEWMAGESDPQMIELFEISELHEKISSLPGKYREVMELVSAGLSEREISEKLSIKAGTVKSRSSRGREMLNKIYSEVKS